MGTLSIDKDIRAKLSRATVGIAGCGGLGSNAAVALVRAGIKRLILVDRDLIERSNLNRQFYFSDQVGLLKAQTLKQNLLSICDDLSIKSFHEELLPGNMHKRFVNCDVVLEALDDAENKVSFIEDMQSNCYEINLVSVSGIAGIEPLDAIDKIVSGSLTVFVDAKAEDASEGVLMAPRIISIASMQALEAVRIILE